MGKQTELSIKPLPIQRAEGFGGYDASEVTAERHHLFEEVQSLGLAADMVMALASHQAEPQLKFRIRMPEHTRASAKGKCQFSIHSLESNQSNKTSPLIC
jgi:hypothetical protein